METKNFDNQMLKMTVIGVGGAGGNAVNRMISAELEGVAFVAANTDAQALKTSLAPRVIQLGVETTQGLGAGSKPEVGRASAEEDLEVVQKEIKGSHMLFIAAGMGGGTGTGAAPVIAKAARDMGILTVGVVTKPFHFEGAHRMRAAERGIEEMQHVVDTLIIIPNQNLFRLANDKTTFADAFSMADQVLYSGVRGVTDLMIMPGLINLDFADVRTIMSEMGKAMMGTGEAEGEGRAIQAAEAAIANPLLDEVSMRGARGVLINITGGMDMTLFEVDEAANRIREEVDEDANIIFGSTFDERLSGRIRVSVVATGIHAKTMTRAQPKSLKQEQMIFSMPQEEPAVIEQEVLVFEVEDSALMEGLATQERDDTIQQRSQSFVDREQESQEKARGFLERFGFKKARPAEERPMAEPAARPMNQTFYEQPKVQPSRDPEEGFLGHYETPPLEDQEKLDIPAFLRKKKPGL